MKRGIITLVLLILLATPLILAQETTTEQAKEQLSALRGGLENKTENILERTITFPPILKVPLKIILGLDEDTTWQQLIVVLGVFIGFFILIFSIVGILPFFKEDLIKVLVSLIVVSLVSMTGALDIVPMVIYYIANFFKLTSLWGPLQVVLVILMIGISIYAINWVSHKIKTKMKMEKVGEIGKKLHKGSEDAETITEGTEKLTKP